MSSARLGGGHMNMGRMSRGSYARPGGFSSSMSGNFARNSTFGRGNFGSSVNSRNFGYSGASQPAARSSRSAMGGWQSFGNSAFRSTPGLARTSGNAMGGGWHSFGNTNGGGRVEMSRSYGSSVRAEGQRQSFGNSAFRSTPGLARTSGNAMGGGWHSFGNMNGGGRAEMSRSYGSNVRADRPVAFIWKFKKWIFWQECFRIFLFRGESRECIGHARLSLGIQLESLFKYAGNVAVLVVLVIFQRPLDGEFRKLPPLRDRGFRQFRFRKLGLRRFGLLKFVSWIGCVAVPQLIIRWLAAFGDIGLGRRRHPRRGPPRRKRNFIGCALVGFRTRLERVRPGRLRWC